MRCEAGYVLVNGKCQWNYLPGDANLDGTPNTTSDKGAPESIEDTAVRKKAHPVWWFLLSLTVLMVWLRWFAAKKT